MADSSRRVFWCACMRVHARVWFAGGDWRWLERQGRELVSSCR